MIEHWRGIPGFEGRYQVSDCGRVKSLSFMQRYVHARTGAEHFRRTREKIRALNLINSGYLVVHLYLDDVCTPCLVHRLVAAAFCPGHFDGADVNHRSGVKTQNAATNLEWVTRTDNHLHAVRHRLHLTAVPVVDPVTRTRYDSIAQAAKRSGHSHRTVRATFERLDDITRDLL